MRPAPLLAAGLLAAATAGAQAPPPPDQHFLYAQLFRAVEMKADLLLEQGKTDAAIAELEKALAVDLAPGEPAYEMRVHLAGRLAITYAQAGRTADAVKRVETTLAEVPPDTVAEATAQLDAGQVFRQLGMNDRALAAFDRAIELSSRLARRPPGPRGGARPPRGESPPPPDP